jgi:DNA modification methylase
MLASHNKSVFEILGRNSIHPFPARMAPGIAFDAIKGAGKPLKILDPMTGSGTVLAVAKKYGHTAIGFDLDPLAVLLSSVWTREMHREAAISSATATLNRARKIHSRLRSSNAFPQRADEETKEFVKYWFDDVSRKQLSCLSKAISETEDLPVRELLWCALSRMIITKKAGVSLAMDLSHSRPHKVYSESPVKPFDQFIASANAVIKNTPESITERSNSTSICHGDARSLPTRSSSIDLVVSSPPYLNAIDYLRCSKFSLIWMGYSISSIKKIRKESVGAESVRAFQDTTVAKETIAACVSNRKKLTNQSEGILAQYINDLSDAVSEVNRVLKKNGKAIYVIGDATMKGTFISNSNILIHVAERCGLKLQNAAFRELPANRRYLPPPQKQSTEKLDGRMRKEAVLSFSKT